MRSLCVVCELWLASGMAACEVEAPRVGRQFTSLRMCADRKQLVINLPESVNHSQKVMTVGLVKSDCTNLSNGQPLKMFIHRTNKISQITQPGCAET